MLTLYKVNMFEQHEDGDLGPTMQVIVQLFDLDGKWIRDCSQNSWDYANDALLKELEYMGMRFIGSLPNLDPKRSKDDNSFWIVVEPKVGLLDHLKVI